MITLKYMRFILVAAMFSAAFIVIISEADDFKTFVISKLAAFAVIIAGIILAKKWDIGKMINE